MLIVVKLVISRIRCLTFTWVGSVWLTGDNRHSCGFIPGKWIAGDVQCMKWNMTLTAARWNSSSNYYVVRSNHIRNVLYRNYRNNSLKAVEE